MEPRFERRFETGFESRLNPGSIKVVTWVGTQVLNLKPGEFIPKLNPGAQFEPRLNPGSQIQVQTKVQPRFNPG